MPELPDVEVYKQYVDATSLHQRITDVDVLRNDLLAKVSVRRLKSQLKGRGFQRTRRHGKYLFIETDDGQWLVLHFGMTGSLDYSKREGLPEHTRMRIAFSKGFRLAYVSQRVLGSVDLTGNPDASIAQKELGIDALSKELDFEVFKQRIRSKRGTIKSALMDQKTIAGIGNLYSDEILFQAATRPATKVDKLDDRSLKRLWRQMRRVLEAAIRARVDPERLPRSYLLPHRNPQGRCPRCDRPLRAAKLSGRTTYFCPHCQKAS